MFSQDVGQEQILTKILYDMLFKNCLDVLWHSTSKLVNFDEYPELQYAGVDIVTTHDIQNTYIDIKCQTNTYINNPTPTFCLELSYCKCNAIKEGWFLKEDQLTDYFLFVWIPNATATNRYIIAEDQLNEIECMLVYKNDIWDYLNNIGITKTDLIQATENLHQMDKHFCKCGVSTKLKITRSDFLPEKPVNLVIPKYQYLAMPHTECFYYNKACNNYFTYVNQTAAKRFLNACG